MLVELEKSGRIGILRLRRPERANALNRSLLEQLLKFQESFRPLAAPLAGVLLLFEAVG